MWIVRLALRRTYTFVVVSMLIAVLGAVSIYRMSTDIFPEIDIPVVSVVWQYSGMPADEIETRISLHQRTDPHVLGQRNRAHREPIAGRRGRDSRLLSSRGQDCRGRGQVTATCQTLLKIMPPGITPPYIVRYSATSVPIVQIAVSSDTLAEQQLFDYANNFIIQRLGTVQGARRRPPGAGNGGKSWSISTSTPSTPGDCRPATSARPSSTKT